MFRRVYGLLNETKASAAITPVNTKIYKKLRTLIHMLLREISTFSRLHAGSQESTYLSLS